MMDPNTDANGPDDPQNDQSNNDKGVDFSSLSPQDQKMMLAAIMQGKPQTPANLNMAKSVLMNDPQTVALLCQKLGIDPDGDDDNDGPDDSDDDDQQENNNANNG